MLLRPLGCLARLAGQRPLLCHSMDATAGAGAAAALPLRLRPAVAAACAALPLLVLLQPLGRRHAAPRRRSVGRKMNE